MALAGPEKEERGETSGRDMSGRIGELRELRGVQSEETKP